MRIPISPYRGIYQTTKFPKLPPIKSGWNKFSLFILFRLVFTSPNHLPLATLPKSTLKGSLQVWPSKPGQIGGPFVAYKSHERSKSGGIERYKCSYSIEFNRIAEQFSYFFCYFDLIQKCIFVRIQENPTSFTFNPRCFSPGFIFGKLSVEFPANETINGQLAIIRVAFDYSDSFSHFGVETNI